MLTREEQHQAIRRSSARIRLQADRLLDNNDIDMDYHARAQFYKEAIEERNRIDTFTTEDFIFIADCHLNQGYLFRKERGNQPDLELREYQTALEIYKNVDAENRSYNYYKILIEYYYFDLMATYCQMGNIRAASKTWSEISQIIKSLDDSYSRVTLQNDLIHMVANFHVHARNLNLSEKEAFYLAILELCESLVTPYARNHREISIIWNELATEVYAVTGQREKEIDAYHSAISELQCIPLNEMTNGVLRDLSSENYNLALTYQEPELQIRKLKLAIKWREKIAPDARNIKDDDELVVYYLKLTQLTGNPTKRKSADHTALLSQPQTIANASRDRGLEKDSSNSNSKPSALKRNSSTMFNVPNQPVVEPEPKRRQSERLRNRAKKC